MIYGAEEPEPGVWLRNLITGDEQPLSAVGYYWLTNDLFLQEVQASGVRQFWVYDVSDNTQTSLQWVEGISGATSRSPDSALVIAPEVVAWFQQAQSRYYVPGSIAIALAADFKVHPGNNYVLATPRANGDPKIIMSFLTDNYLPYTEIRGMFGGQNPLISHDGRFVAVGSRITTPEGEILAQTTDYIDPITGWAHDDSGVYFQPAGESGAPILMPLFRTSKTQPILKLKVPADYLQSGVGTQH
jgi:hypothetical protein